MSRYFDHAATSPTDQRVAESVYRAMLTPANSSSVHRGGQAARALLELYREELANLLGLPSESLLFTSGATEANNLAIRGFSASRKALSRPVLALTSPIEHSSVRTTIERLNATGELVVQPMAVSGNGEAVIPSREETQPDLLCLMAVQNETGVIQQLDAARRFRDDTGAFWLCDATQAVGLWPERLSGIGADLFSFSSHKIYGPPGVGALAGPGLSQLRPIITGGPQERELRAGTQPIALIGGFVAAARLAAQEREQRTHHLQSLTALLVRELSNRDVNYRINGEGAARLAGFLNISVAGLSGPDLVIALDGRGFAVSSGSACATGVMETSPAMAAMFLHDEPRAAAALRITMGKDNTEEDVVELAKAIGEIAGKR